jgi:ParB family transcriptional regulator, chromosome partitioning protein
MFARRSRIKPSTNWRRPSQRMGYCNRLSCEKKSAVIRRCRRTAPASRPAIPRGCRDHRDGPAPIPCHVITNDVDATEISLAENVQREPMHPADEFEAFKALIDRGTPHADVAARFGVTEAVVEKRLKLANVSPALLTAYRNGEMTLQHIMAFTVTDDHAAQERVWNDCAEWQQDDPDAIRDMLTEGEITAKDRRVRFVTLKAYEKAGGAVRRDLFSEDDTGVFIQDIVLLESLVAKKLEKAAHEVRRNGWKWVEIHTSFDHGEWSNCQRRHPEPLPLSSDQQAELETLTAESDALWAIEGELDQEQQSRLDTITERIDRLENRERVWPHETLSIAGAVVTLGSDGKADIRYGYIQPEDAPKKAVTTKTVMQAQDDGTVVAVEVADAFTLSASLIESLTAHRSASLSATLMDRRDIALAATVHAMALQVFYNGAPGDTVLQITATTASLRRVEGSAACMAIVATQENWGENIPGDAADLFAWCLAQPQGRLLDLLAFCAAQTVNAVMLKADRSDSSRMDHAALLADALKLDMAKWFTPTAANYFSRISKAGIIEALRQVKGATAPAWNGMKKADLAALAERETAGAAWLPEVLRAPAIAQAKA